MDRSLFTKCLFVLSFSMTVSTLVYADEEAGFDSIVRELKTSLKDPAPSAKVDDESTRIIAGAALAGSYVDAGAGSTMLSGFDLHLGIELFSPRWTAETSLRSFSTGRVDKTTSISMDEYDIKLVHQGDLQKTLSLRIGGGMSAQYLKTIQAGNSSSTQTPSLIAMVGVDKTLTPRVSVGPDVSYRLPLVNDSSEKGSLDASLRLNFYF